MNRLLWVVCCVVALRFPAPALGQANVLTYHNDNARTGQNLNETLLTRTNVNSSAFGKLGSYNVDGYVYAQPLYVSSLPIPGQGVRNAVFIATEHNTVYAFDADGNTGPTHGLLWQTNLGISAATPNNDFGNRYQPYPDIRPEVGITGTPVIDLVSGTLYVDAFTHEGTNYFHRLHALNITNGTEQLHSPVVVSASTPGIGAGSTAGRQVFNPVQQLQRSALTLAGGILYVTYCGYGDTDPYHGWVIGFNPATLQQLTNYVFNTTPNSTTAAYGANAGEGGIWMAGGGLAVDANTNLYFEVGNGIFNATNNSGGTEYGDSFIRLSTTNQLAVADYFTPYNQFTLQANDTDLGSGGVMLLPDQPGNFPHLLVGAGKEGKIYLINRDLMTTGNNHYDATNTVDHVVQTLAGQIKGSFGTPAWFNGRIYYAATGDKLKAFALSSGLLSPNPVSVGPRTFGFPGATPSVTANGTNDGIIWTLQMGSPAVLAAYDPANLAAEIYNSAQAAGNRDLLPNGVKFAVPTIASGKVYVGGQYAVSIFGALASTNGFTSPDIALQGTAILGVKDAVDGSLGTPRVHAGVAASINDGNPSTRVDNFFGGGGITNGPVSYVGVLWPSVRSDQITNLTLTLATFLDGGWFGVSNSGPAAGGLLSPSYLIEPTVQASTDGGVTWTNLARTSDYLTALNGHGIGGGTNPNPTSVTASFTLTQPVSGINGLRILGQNGGTADGNGFIGVSELEIYAAPFADTDNDGMPDAWELAHGLIVGVNDANLDPDGDGLTNLQEYRAGTDPHNPDTDGDGLTDGQEVNIYFTNPLMADTDGDGLTDGAEVNAHHTNPLVADTDGDGLSDGAEVNTYHTNPLVADTDGDGFPDGMEVAQGTDPNNPNSHPVNYALLATGILGTRDALDSGLEAPLFNAGVAGNLNDGNLTTRVDTFNGPGTSTASFVGMLWNQPLTHPIGRLKLSLATFFDGGWFGVNNVSPGAGGSLSAAADLFEPTLQVTTNSGGSWTTIAQTSDYLSALNGHPLPAVAYGPPTLATATFQLNEPQTGINGIRIIGTEGGTASGGFLGVFEFAVEAAPQPVSLVNLAIAGGQFQFEFDSQVGVTHLVQFKTSLAFPGWQTLATIPGDGTRKRVTDNLTDTLRIYRVTSQ
jgi:hypothetical protein